MFKTNEEGISFPSIVGSSSNDDGDAEDNNEFTFYLRISRFSRYIKCIFR